jgi:hypothetical protein
MGKRGAPRGSSDASRKNRLVWPASKLQPQTSEQGPIVISDDEAESAAATVAGHQVNPDSFIGVLAQLDSLVRGSGAASSSAVAAVAPAASIPAVAETESSTSGVSMMGGRHYASTQPGMTMASSQVEPGEPPGHSAFEDSMPELGNDAASPPLGEFEASSAEFESSSEDDVDAQVGGPVVAADHQVDPAVAAHSGRDEEVAVLELNGLTGFEWIRTPVRILGDENELRFRIYSDNPHWRIFSGDCFHRWTLRVRTWVSKHCPKVCDMSRDMHVFGTWSDFRKHDEQFIGWCAAYFIERQRNGWRHASYGAWLNWSLYARRMAVQDMRYYVRLNGHGRDFLPLDVTGYNGRAMARGAPVGYEPPANPRW